MQCCQFQFCWNTLYSLNMLLALPARTSSGWSYIHENYTAQNMLKYRIWSSTEVVWALCVSPTVSVKFSRTHIVQMELELTVLHQIICKLWRLTEKYFPSWVCCSKVILCWDNGFVSPMVHKTRPTGTFIQMNEHHPIRVQCEWSNDRAVSIVLVIIDCECMYLQLIWHFTKRNTSHLYMAMRKIFFHNISCSVS